MAIVGMCWGQPAAAAGLGVQPLQHKLAYSLRSPIPDLHYTSLARRANAKGEVTWLSVDTPEDALGWVLSP